MRLHTCIMFFSGTWIIYCMTLLAQKYIWSPLSTSLHHLLSWFWVSDHIRVAIEIFPGRSSKRCRAAVETVEEMLRLEVSGCATGRHQIGRSTWEEISIIFLGSSGCNTKTHIYIYIDVVSSHGENCSDSETLSTCTCFIVQCETQKNAGNMFLLAGTLFNLFRYF